VGRREICGTTAEDGEELVRAAQAAQPAEERSTTTSPVRELVAAKIDKTRGKITAKRLLPVARACRLRRLRPQTSAGSWPRRRPVGGKSVDAGAARECGRRAMCWPSTWGQSGSLYVSVPCWRGRG